MPHFRPGTFIIDIEELTVDSIRDVLSELLRHGVKRAHITTAPSVVDVDISGRVYSIAIGSFAILVSQSEASTLSSLGFKVYRVVKDAWIDSVEINVESLLELLWGLLKLDGNVLSKHGVVFESSARCENVVFSFPLVVKAPTRLTPRELSLSGVYALYREMLRDEKVLLAVCIENTAISPYAWIESRGDKRVLVLREPSSLLEKKVALKIVIDYLASKYR
jgi:hypothetical protein